MASRGCFSVLVCRISTCILVLCPVILFMVLICIFKSLSLLWMPWVGKWWHRPSSSPMLRPVACWWAGERARGVGGLSSLPDSEGACALSPVSNRCDKQPASAPTSTDHQPHPNYPAQKCKYEPPHGSQRGAFPGRQRARLVCVRVCFLCGRVFSCSPEWWVLALPGFFLGVPLMAIRSCSRKRESQDRWSGFFFFFLTMLCSSWDLRSPSRDWTCYPWQWKHQVLTTELPGNSPSGFLKALHPWSFHDES